VQSVISAYGLWSAGREQPSVVRHRMRALSLGALVVALSLVSSSASSDPNSGVKVVTTFVGVFGICLLVLAFVVPTWLRESWRAADLVELSRAERSLMVAVTVQDVADAIVPALIKLFGASGAALVGFGDVAINSEGLDRAYLSGLHERLAAMDPSQSVVLTDEGLFACRMSSGWLVVRAGAFAPLFGTAELSLLDRVGSFVDLALQRCVLFQQEAQSKRAAVAANAELQTLVYSVSHDLRNPIISVLGYLDVLAQEHAGELTGEGPHYLERISVNAMYMQSLIADLLELSRIGRSEPPSQAVPMGLLAESVAQEVRVMHPSCTITVTGTFPVIWMSDLRARQLLTNLVDNAAKHAGAAAAVTVTAQPDGAEGAVILVADNGKGIPALYRDKAFDVFERLDAARSDVPGTGMGLPICKRIVESLGGRISLEGPTSPFDSGTTARITLAGPVVRGWGESLPATDLELSR
jgi:signal transduction histidine kinase